MARISTYQPMFSNDSVATAPDLRVAERLEMEKRVRRFLADFADHCIQTVPVMERVEQTAWLQDMKRPDGKRNQKFVEQFCDLVQLAGKAENALMLAEGIHGETLRQMSAPSQCRVEAYRAETKEQAEHDVVQARFMEEPTETWRDAAIKEGTEALAALRHWLNVLHLWKPRAA